MIEIKDLLNRFNNLLISGEIKKNIIIDVLYKTIGLKIDSKDIQIKNNIIYLNIKPIYKNEIFFKKEEIFVKLQESLGNKTPTNIV